jgi:hypothetical protein
MYDSDEVIEKIQRFGQKIKWIVIGLLCVCVLAYFIWNYI